MVQEEVPLTNTAALIAVLSTAVALGAPSFVILKYGSNMKNRRFLKLKANVPANRQ
jgi:hypothetical protein